MPLNEKGLRNGGFVRGSLFSDLKFSPLDTDPLVREVLQEERYHSRNGLAARSRSRKVPLWFALPLRIMQAVSNTDLNGEASVHEATHAGKLGVTKASIILIPTSVPRTIHSRTIFKAIGKIFYD